MLQSDLLLAHHVLQVCSWVLSVCGLDGKRLHQLLHSIRSQEGRQARAQPAAASSTEESTSIMKLYSHHVGELFGACITTMKKSKPSARQASTGAA
jgi:hypothetical protein